MRARDLRLDDESGRPIYAQVRDQILGAIGRGTLKVGQQLPTVREIAVALAINPNTVNRAYMELERAGTLTTTRGRGTFVASAPRRDDPALRRARLREIADRALGQARAAGFEPSELTRMIDSLQR